MLKPMAEKLAPFALLVLRVIVGLVFVIMGVPKLTGVAGTATFFGSVGIPAPGFFAIFVGLLETFGGLALILGIAVRWVGLLFIIEMLVTTLVVKMPRVGFIAPAGRPGVGAELDLLMLSGALILVAFGAGRISLEHALLKREI
jgi:putative oxidoreductase